MKINSLKIILQIFGYNYFIMLKNPIEKCGGFYYYYYLKKIKLWRLKNPKN
jgi:hypothetical protein